MIRNPNALCAQIAEAARASDFGTACHFMLDLADFLGPGGVHQVVSGRDSRPLPKR